jgi:hypothetical protein
MATPCQIAANKLNAQKSTGPKTEAGKARSCLNHLSHGFTSNTADLIPEEDPEEFKALLADLMAEYQPATPTEQILVERMCQNQWLSGRAFRFQNNVINICIARQVNIPKDLALFIRYQNGAERNFHRAHADLLNAQKERKKSEIGFESQNADQPVDAPLESPAQCPNPPGPPQKTTAASGLSVPQPPQWHDFESSGDQLAAPMTSPDAEIAKAGIEELPKRRKAA